MKKNLGVLFFLSIVLLSACSTDLDVTGDWKETMVVYGLLDQNQPKQYIKINKAFLGQGNALEYAQVKDSVQFANALTVTLKRIKNGSEIASYNLTQDNTIPKNSGTFYSGSQGNAIYSFASTGANKLYEDSQYKLVIKNSETGNEVTSQSILVSDFGNLSNPSVITSQASIIVINADDYPYTVNFKSAPNARVYQVVLRLMYSDSTTSGNVNDSVDWDLGEKQTSTLDGGEVMDYTFKGQAYMKYLGSVLHDYTGLLARRAGNLKIIVVAAADDLNTFIDVNKPSTTIIQEKPEFTNITNGLGIFSARMTKIPFDHPLSGVSLDTLSGGRYTKCLKFLSGGVWLGATTCE